MASNTSKAGAPVLTVQEVAQALRLSEWTVRRYIAAGRLPAVRIGGQWRIGRNALDVLIALAGSDMSSRATVTLNSNKESE